MCVCALYTPWCVCDIWHSFFPQRSLNKLERGRMQLTDATINWCVNVDFDIKNPVDIYISKKEENKTNVRPLSQSAGLDVMQMVTHKVAKIYDFVRFFFVFVQCIAFY